MVYISFREKRGRCKKMNTFLKRNQCIDTGTGISEWFRSICNLQTHTGLIPTVVTSVWQHVTHPISKHTHSLPHTHEHTLLRAWLRGTVAVCWELRLRPTRLYGSLSPTPTPPPQGSGGGIELPVQRRPGLELAAACDLGCLCVLSPTLWGYQHTALLSLQVCRCDLHRPFVLMHVHTKCGLLLSTCILYSHMQ